MAAYVKGLDPNHLLSVGSEGFYSPADTAQAGADPPRRQLVSLTPRQDVPDLLAHTVKQFL